MNKQKETGHGAILVTGGSRGIGAAVCRLAAARGYDVLFSYQSNHGAAEALQQEIRLTGSRCIAVQSDVARETDVIRLFEIAVTEFGHLDGVVNNAGILETQMPLAEMSVDRIDRVLATNVRGSLLCAREAVKHMSTSRGGKGGAIVNLSSRAAALGAPGEYIDYAASKGAIDSLTIGLAKEVGDQGIRVNAVRPGIIETDIHADGGEPGRVERIGPTVPLGRGGTATEVAESILWLLSPGASYCNGALLDISGGR